MVSLPQLQRDLREVESQIRFTRHRLQCYELLGDTELAAHTERVITGLEDTKQTLAKRLQLPQYEK